MPDSGLPTDVREFIRQHVSSIEQLEILLHLFEIAPKKESSEEIARALYLSPESTARQLAMFHGKGLVNRIGDAPGVFGIDAKSSQIGLQVESLSQCYRERRVSVINEIFSNPISTIQSFADAFIIGKKKQ